MNTHSSSSAVVPPSAGHLADERDQPERQQRREADRDVRRAPRRVHLAEHGGQHVLAAHAVDQTARHQHVDQRAVGDREHGDEAENPERKVRRAGLHDLEQRRLAFAELLRRHQRDRRDRHQHVDRAGDEQAGEQHLRKDADGVLASSAMFTESSNPTMAKKASVVAAITGQNVPSSPVLNCVTRETSPCRADRPQADEDDDQQAGQLDAGEHDVDLHALADAAEIDDATSAMKARPTR